MSYTLNDTFFDVIDSESKAYFLGLLYADGCVQPSGESWRIRLGLEILDRDIVSAFRDVIEYTGPLYITKKRATLQVSSKRFGDDLIRQGCIPRKSLVLKYPNISDALAWHFIRGYFDGDGCLSISGRGARWTLVGTFDLLSRVATKIDGIGIHTSVYPKGNVYILSVSGNRQIKTLLDHLYTSATYFMERKWQKAIQFQELLTSIRPIRKVAEAFDQGAIVTAYVGGMKIMEIEKQFCITNKTVYKFLKKNNVPLRQK